MYTYTTSLVNYKHTCVVLLLYSSQGKGKRKKEKINGKGKKGNGMIIMALEKKWMLGKLSKEKKQKNEDSLEDK